MADPTPQDVSQLIEQAHLCLVREDYDGARRLADQVLAVRPTDPDAPGILREARLRGRKHRRAPSARTVAVVRGMCAVVGVACLIGIVLLFPSTGRIGPYEGAGPIVHGLHRAEWKLLGCVLLGIVGLVAFAGAGGLDPEWRDLDKQTDTRATHAFLRWWW